MYILSCSLAFTACLCNATITWQGRYQILGLSLSIKPLFFTPKITVTWRYSNIYLKTISSMWKISVSAIFTQMSAILSAIMSAILAQLSMVLAQILTILAYFCYCHRCCGDVAMFVLVLLTFVKISPILLPYC